MPKTKFNWFHHEFDSALDYSSIPSNPINTPTGKRVQIDLVNLKTLITDEDILVEQREISLGRHNMMHGIVVLNRKRKLLRIIPQEISCLMGETKRILMTIIIPYSYLLNNTAIKEKNNVDESATINSYLRSVTYTKDTDYSLWIAAMKPFAVR